MIKEGINNLALGMTSFLMAGQSNMAGRGDIDEVEPIENEKCFMYRVARWEKMVEPINVDKRMNSEYAPGISLAASFADAYAKHFDAPVGLIPCANGGTKIEQWRPGGDLFDYAVACAKLAMRTSKLGGILWHQGESDSRHFDPDVYSEKLITTMKAFREALDMPTLPIIIGEISEKCDEKWYVSKVAPEINKVLHSVAKCIPNCAVVKARDLGLRVDGIHFSSSSLRTLGVRYFEKYLDVIGSKE